ncbi:polyprenyl synthetase family protein [Serpentinicella alkaliphila]|uniref:Farnesyl diphosphate synthase n=1 Tax=Serpentinicella alkaliphila TaxID=1734049 RepID=A0A4V2T3X6_9FIRM|nr:farnesyl diphosphate synthase [Serpentinicella alkaliphila]QUH26638.1 polyprenyl synthetase family protein [Serpentinicella alkaliphila]TCQ02894.1 farnesyl-diphosphate synthase [Serpentinicella alkaliphila]
MSWKNELTQYMELINKHLDQVMNMEKEENYILIDSMKYSLFAGGKRLRPVLALASYQLFANDLNNILPYACGLEMIHTYSLIHDDLPAMDNDDYRRGKLTNHKVFGEGIAVLAGDGLLNHSFELMLGHALTQPQMEPYVRSIYEIAKAAGIQGMIGGQTVDLQSENVKVSAETLNYIHLKKTAALIIASLKIGAIIGNGNKEDINNMELIGKNLGLAFQIQDDILDIIGDQSKLGKDVGSDQEKNKSTYPSMYGLDFSINKVKELTNSIYDTLNKYGEKAIFLKELCNYLVDREY